MYCQICTELGESQLYKEPFAILSFGKNLCTKGYTLLLGVNETASRK